MERFVIIVNGFQSLIIITKGSILDATAALDPPLGIISNHSLKQGTVCQTVRFIPTFLF